MALPVEKAADLAKDMASKGLVGSISMGKPKMGDKDSSSDKEEPEMDDFHMLGSDLMDAVESGSVDAIASVLRNLVSMIKEQDSMSDTEMP